MKCGEDAFTVVLEASKIVLVLEDTMVDSALFRYSRGRNHEDIPKG